MPKRRAPAIKLESLPLEERAAMQDFQQTHWYKVVGNEYVKTGTVLDCGAGSGYGMKLMRDLGATETAGIDPLPYGPEVRNTRIEDIDSLSFDWVTCMDVIEHVDDDIGLLNEMLRVARIGVFFSTPNWRWYRCSNPYHVREYTPEELQKMVGDTGLRYEAWEGPDDPEKIVPRKMQDIVSIAGSNFGVALWKNT